MNPSLIDTDVLSAIMRGTEKAVAAATGYVSSHSQLSISAITRYEILRGLQAKNASAQIVAFNMSCDQMAIILLDDGIITRAAEIYGHLHQTGQLIGDADILIAATCLEKGCELATHNVSHFSRVPGLVINDWLA